MTHFYLTLPSNSSMDYYENTPQNYKIKLSKPMDFSGKDYEVGLVEIQYPHTWYTLTDDTNILSLTYTYTEIVEDGISMYQSEKVQIIDNMRLQNSFTDFIHIPKGMYKDIRDLIAVMNNELKKARKGDISFELLPHTFKVRLHIKDSTTIEQKTKYDLTYIHLSSHLCRLLGFKEAAAIHDFKNTSYTYSYKTHHTDIEFDVQQRLLEQNYFESTYPSDINRGMYSLFVYSDIVSQQVVGDTHAPLLRTIPIESKINTVVTRTFDLPHYLPAKQQIFDSVEIDIRDDTGNPIPFTYGKVLIKLHFRLRRSPYFE